MVEFMNDEEREKFRGMFMQCSKDMHGHVVNHKLVSLLAAGSPRKESPISKTPKSVSFRQSPVIIEDSTPEPELEETRTPEPELEETPKKDPPESRPHNICANLKQEFEELSHEILNEPEEAAPITSQDISLEIIKEVLPSADKQVKESELSLPKGFYNYEDKESCSGCVGCDDDETDGDTVTISVSDQNVRTVSVSDNNVTNDNSVKKAPSPPALYDVIPALDPSSQASPFGLNNPVNSFASVSQGTNLFGISPSSSSFTNPPGISPSSSPFTNPPSNSNIFLQNQSNSGNIFLQGNTSTDNIFLQSKNTENIFLKSAPTEENIFLKSSDQSPVTPQKSANTSINPFASPPMPSLSAEPAQYGNADDHYGDDYEYDENYEDYEDYEDDYNYNEIQEED